MPASVRKHNEFSIITIEEKLTVKEIIDVKNIFNDQKKNGATYFAFNLNNIAQIDSSGIGLLMNMHKIANKSNGYFCIYNLSDECKEILQISGLYDVLTIFKDEEEFIENTSL